MSINSYHELVVWQKSIDLVVSVYKLIKLLPKEEMYALSTQMRRSAVSIPSNIAEGQQRRSTKEYLNFISIAKGSNAELQTQFIICMKLGYLTADAVSPAMALSEEISKMLISLADKLSSRATYI